MNLVDKICHMWRKDYAIIEIRSEYYNKKELKQYSFHVKDIIKEKFPDLNIISFKWSNYLEIHWDLFLAVYGIKASGYRIKFTHNANALLLKEECMKLEVNADDKRVSDIDLYVKDKDACGGFKKISRKDPIIKTRLEELKKDLLTET